MMRPLFFAAALAWTMTALVPAAARDGLATTMRAVLYEEDLSDPKGHRTQGQVTWQIEPTTDASAPSGDVTIRGTVEIPSRHLRMTLAIRRNFDPKLPATHTVEIEFSPDFTAGKVKQIMGLLMKAHEQAKAAALASLSARIDDTHFLIGLSAVPQDASKNSLLIRSRAWMDIAIVYATQRRAILAIEKNGDVLPLFNTVFDQ